MRGLFASQFGQLLKKVREQTRRSLGIAFILYFSLPLRVLPLSFPVFFGSHRVQVTDLSPYIDHQYKRWACRQVLPVATVCLFSTLEKGFIYTERVLHASDGQCKMPWGHFCGLVTPHHLHTPNKSKNPNLKNYAIFLSWTSPGVVIYFSNRF